MKTFNTLLFFTFFTIFMACKPEVQKQDFTLKGNVFGTSYKITYLKASKNHQKSLDSLFVLINKSVSTYMPTSDISKINNGNSNIIVDEIFTEVFNKSKKFKFNLDNVRVPQKYYRARNNNPRKKPRKST